MTRREYYHQPDAPVAASIRVAVTAFVRDGAGSVLMIRRRDNDLLSLPGGVQEVGETLSHAAVREVKEETGINVEVTGLIGLYSDPDYVITHPDGTVAQDFSVCFRARPYGGQMRVSTESSQVHWVDPESLGKLHLSPGSHLCVEHGLAERDQPYYT